MLQTDQYGLNQWELSDRIRMEDFNADNAKIEAALAELKAVTADLNRRKFQRQKFYQATSPCLLLNQTFTDVDWSLFSRVHFVMEIYTTAACTLFPYVYSCKEPDSFQVPATDTPRRTMVHTTLFPGHNGDNLAWATISTEVHSVTRVFDFPFHGMAIAGVRANGYHMLAGSNLSVYTEG